MKKTVAALAMLGIAAFLLIACMPSIVHAEGATGSNPAANGGGDSANIKLDNPLGAGATIPSILRRIFNQLAIMLGFAVPIVVIVGAFQMMFAAGNPEKFATGQKTIAYAIIGYILILMANGLVSIVQKILTPSS